MNIFAAYVQLVFMCFYLGSFFVVFLFVFFFLLLTRDCFPKLEMFFFLLLSFYSLNLSLNEKSMLALFPKEAEGKNINAILMRLFERLVGVTEENS